MSVTLHHGDCLEVMHQIPDGSVDMVLCDLPYGTTANKWDSVIPLAPLWAHYKRVCKPNAAIVLHAQAPFSAVLTMSNLRWFRYEWAWDKVTATGFLNARRMPLKMHENILIFYRTLPTYNAQMVWGTPYNAPGKKPGTMHCYRAGRDNLERTRPVNDGRRYPTSLLRFPPDRLGLHPTAKPVALSEYLIRTYTNPGDLVLDNCMGSGTTVVAALQEGRRCIGIERDPGYFEIARRRIEAVPVPLFRDEAAV